MPFTGRAVYSNYVTLREDVADVVSMISPKETPLLDRLGDAANAATNFLHQWEEDELSPNTIVASSNVASTTADTAMGVAGGKAGYLQVGMMLRQPTTGEYFIVTVIAGNTITLQRGFGGTTPTSFAAGQSLDVIADAGLEGADVEQDSSTIRVHKSNYLQLFKKDVIVSGSMGAVSLHGGIDDEFMYQRDKKIAEALRDLEKAVILGILSGNTIGSATARRSMAGIRALLTTNVRSVGPNLTESWFGTAIQDAWSQGGTDIDLVVCGVNYKRIIDSWNNTRKFISNTDETYRAAVSMYESTFGELGIMLSRWMPANEALILATGRVSVPPLQKRSFQFREVVSQGDSRKGFVVGEYTVELRQEAGMARIL